MNYEEESSFDELIEELRALKIRENDIIDRLARVNRAQVNAGNDTPSNRVVAQAPATNSFKRGDRVRITNKVRKPATAGANWSESRERLATVTRVIPDQVHILTDNGTRTWRAPNNLQIIGSQ